MSRLLGRLGAVVVLVTVSMVAARLDGVGAASEYVALSPSVRLVDTRPGESTVDGRDAGIGRRAGESTLDVQIAGRGGVPLDASSVVLTVTAVRPLDNGYLTVYPAGTDRPLAASSTYTAGHNTANTVIARLGSDGMVSIFTHAAVHLVVDASGHLAEDGYTPLAVPRRLADTRPGTSTIDGQHAGLGFVPGGNGRQVRVTGRADVPADASVAVLTVTAVRPHDTGHVTVYPTGTDQPLAANSTYSAGRTTANTVLARLGAGGDVCIFTHSDAHLVVDVTGYLAGPPPPAAGPMCPLGPLPTWQPPKSPTGLDEVPLFTTLAASASGVVNIASSSGTPGEPAATDVWFSAEGLDWETLRLPGVQLLSIVDGGPGFVAVGSEPSRSPGGQPLPAVRTSVDGSAWATAASIDNGPFPFGEMTDVTVTATSLVAVGHAWDTGGQPRPAVWTSPNGATWTLVPGDPLGSVGSTFELLVAAGEGGVVLIGRRILQNRYPGPMIAWWSPDGLAWRRTPDLSDADGFVDPEHVVDFGSGFVLVGMWTVAPRRPWASSSSDGINWSSRIDLPVRPETDFAGVNGLAADDSTLIAVGTDESFGPLPGTDAIDPSAWMTTDPARWVQVSADVLRGGHIADEDPTRIGSIYRSANGWGAVGTVGEAGQVGPTGGGVVWPVL